MTSNADANYATTFLCVSAKPLISKATDAKTQLTQKSPLNFHAHHGIALVGRRCRPGHTRTRAFRSLIRAPRYLLDATRCLTRCKNSLLILPVSPLSPSWRIARRAFHRQTQGLSPRCPRGDRRWGRYSDAGNAVSQTRPRPGCPNHAASAQAALTRATSCVYSALFRRVDVARRVLSCLPANRVRVPPIPQGMVVRSPPGGLNRVSS